MKIVDLDLSDAISFFRILDVDESARLEIDEFVMGCMRFMGKAKTVDIETLTHENRRLMRHSANQSACIEQSLEPCRASTPLELTRQERLSGRTVDGHGTADPADTVQRLGALGDGDA